MNPDKIYKAVMPSTDEGLDGYIQLGDYFRIPTKEFLKNLPSLINMDILMSGMPIGKVTKAVYNKNTKKVEIEMELSKKLFIDSDSGIFFKKEDKT